jgi:Zn-dependent metalloprotease
LGVKGGKKRKKPGRENCEARLFFANERRGTDMKTLRIVLIVFVAWTLLLGGAMAAEEKPTSRDISPAIQKELMDQLTQQTGAKARVKTNVKTGNLNYVGVDPSNAIRQPAKLSDTPTAEEAARGFLSVYGPLFGLKDQARELRIMRSKEADQGRSSVRFQQVHLGIPVFGGESIVLVDSSHNIISAHSKILPGIDVDTSPVVTPEIAEKTAREVFTKTYKNEYEIDISSLQISKPELWIYNPLLLGMGEDITYLVWRLQVVPGEPLPIREIVLVDAHLGDVVFHFNQNPTALYRRIYDHGNSPGHPLPGYTTDLKRSEGGAVSSITDVNNAYDFAGDTYNFYYNTHGRDSIDNAGMQLVSTTRFCPDFFNCPYENAFWTGAPYNQMVYGQGFASADDVVAHEMTHGVTDYESNLIYYKQSGAINESFSDIWGEFVDLTNGRGDDSPGVRWLMGEDIGAIRSMSNPPLYGDPDKMSSTYYYCGTCDQAGVHTNSGVGNKLAYLLTDGAIFNGYTVTGLGITKVAKIFYEVQRNLLISSSDYEDLANALVQGCTNLVGTSGITVSDCQQVANAVYATEVNTKWVGNVVQNPGFESGNVSWAQYSSGGYYLITNSTYYYASCGDWYGWLGGYNGAVEYMYQDITIPSNATQASLQFRWGVDTYESSGTWDYMYVLIKRPSDNALLSTLATITNADAGGWYLSTSYNLLSFKGQTIRLMFYATNDVSYPTNFLLDDVVLKVVVPSTPGKAALMSPSGAIGTNTPTYTWNAVPNAEWYQIWVGGSSGTKVDRWYTRGEAGCASGTGTCSVTPTTEVIGLNQWWVRTYNTVGLGPWSGPSWFTAPSSPPIAATQVSPTGVWSDSTPTYTWNAVSNATWYSLYVNDATGNKINQWYTREEAGCASGIGNCAVTPTTEVRGSSQWWVRTYNAAGLGPWSVGMSFTAPSPTVPPGAATQVSPNGGWSDSTPTYTWNAVSTATWYSLYVNDSGGNKINQWYAAADAGCADGAGTCSVTPTTMVLGTYNWYIRTYNSGGVGPWSSGKSFTVSP